MLKLRLLLSVWLFSLISINVLHAQWVQTSGLSDGKIRCLLVSDTTVFAGTDDSGAWRSTENGTDWTAINTGLTSTFILSFAESGTNLLAGTAGGVFISTDFGSSWNGINNGLIDTYIYAVAAIGQTLFAGTNDSGVFVSTNNGTNWTVASAGLTNKTVTSLIISPNGVGGSNIFAGTYGGGIFLSTNDGASWSAVNNGLTSGYVRKLAAVPNGTGGLNIFAGTYYNGVFFSTDNGSNWTAVNTGLTEYSILSLAQSGSNIFAGTDDGVFLSTNNGTSWTVVNTGLTTLHIMALAASDSYLFAGTSNTGVWKRPLSDMITPVSVSSDKLIKEFCLEQNYPNPFNPTTKIIYTIPDVGTSFMKSVKLKIYDLLGREIATLVDGIKSPGEHTVEWNAQNYPSGVYFYRLQSDYFTQTKKLVLLK
jgi:hypothetical protein